MELVAGTREPSQPYQLEAMVSLRCETHLSLIVRSDKGLVFHLQPDNITHVLVDVARRLLGQYFGLGAQARQSKLDAKLRIAKSHGYARRPWRGNVRHPRPFERPSSQPADWTSSPTAAS